MEEPDGTTVRFLPFFLRELPKRRVATDEPGIDAAFLLLRRAERQMAILTVPLVEGYYTSPLLRITQGARSRIARRTARHGNARVPHRFVRRSYAGTPRSLGEVAREEIPRHRSQAGRGRARRACLDLPGRQRTRAARVGELRRCPS